MNTSLLLLGSKTASLPLPTHFRQFVKTAPLPLLALQLVENKNCPSASLCLTALLPLTE